MFSLFKKSKDKIEIPQWASFLNASEYQRFISTIENYFYSRNITYTLGDGLINVGPNDFGFGIMGLVNVAQVCKQSESIAYEDIVKEHFETLIRTFQFDKEFEKSIEDFDKIEQYLGVRLYSADYFAQVGKENIVVRDFSEDVVATLIFDLPDAVQSIKPEETNTWNKSLDQLFSIGIKNIKSRYKFDISLQQFNDFKIWLVQGDHFFTPNILFDLENQPKLIGTYGSLIGMPHRHMVMIYPIENIETVNVINAIIPTVNGIFNEGPGSLSPNLFWFHKGIFEILPYRIEENAIQFYPSEAFLNVLNSFQ